MTERRTGWLWHEAFAWHDTGRARGYHPLHRKWVEQLEHWEHPDTKRRFHNLVEVSNFSEHLVPLKPAPANDEQILRFHLPEYVDRVRRLSAEEGGDAGQGSPFSHGAYEIALLAAGGTITAVNAVLDGAVDNAYALVRPPGHHAERDRGRGFCIFGNAAIAIMHAFAERGIERAATVDWDVHHGNGTQQAFYDDPDVLTISLHQEQWFPRDLGSLAETGQGDGDGRNINVPLPPGSGHGAYLAAIQRVVLPALRAFRPQLIVVPSGFDGGMYDPLGRMMAYSGTFREMTRMLLEAADQLCEGRLVLTHEGGYSPLYVPFCGIAVLEQLSGRRSGVVDPFEDNAATAGGQDLQPHQSARIAEAEALVDQLRIREGVV